MAVARMCGVFGVQNGGGVGIQQGDDETSFLG